MEDFRAMCKVPVYGKMYTINPSDDAINFNPVVVDGSFLIKPMRENKFQLKTKLMKARF